MNESNYCIIQLTSNATRMMRSRTHSDALIHTVDNDLRANLETGNLLFAALRHFEVNCMNRWIFMGDDDTLFFDRGIARFLHERRGERVKPVAYGNIYDAYNTRSWFTGGSGLLLSPEITRLILRTPTLEWQKEALWCACGDVPLARAIKAVGGRMIHKPNHFLDSCLYCKTHPVRSQISTCHGVSMFRDRNPHTNTKRNRDHQLVEFDIRITQKRRHRMKELYKLCS